MKIATHKYLAINGDFCVRFFKKLICFSKTLYDKKDKFIFVFFFLNKAGLPGQILKKVDKNREKSHKTERFVIKT